MTDRTLPAWDLSPIFSGIDGEDFRQTLSSVDALCGSMKAAIDSRLPLKDIVDIYNRLCATYETLGDYTSALLSTDTGNAAYLKAVTDVEAKSVALSEVENLFVQALGAREAEIDVPELSDYSYVLHHMAEDARHRMSLKEETLAADLARSGSSAFSRLFDTITSSLADDGRTLTELRSDAYSPDRALRKSSYEREKRILAQAREPLAAALNGIKGSVLTIESRQGWKSPLEHSAFISRVSMKTLEALVATLKSAQPMFRDYFRIKARLLGLDQLVWYDIFAPVSVPGACHREYSFADARALVVDSYSSFSSQMGEFARKAFDENWIDAAPHKGKVGGAYDTAFPLVGQSRVFTNFSFDYSSVSTLAHELGHAYHDSVVMSRPALLSSYPMPLAETASIFAEQILFQKVLSTSSEAEAIPLIESFVSDAAQVCTDILSRFLFESALFEARKEGEATADDMCRMMAQAQEESYGDAVADKHEYMWAVKGHYYSADFSFYNYPYAFGQLFALGLFARSGRDVDFAQKYRTLLSMTGQYSAEDVAASAGCDITSGAFWQEGIDVIASYVERMKRFADKM